MKRHAVIVPVLAALIAAAGPIVSAGPALAYSYAAAGAEPLLDGREALFAAASAGKWDDAKAAVATMQADLDYLDQNEDKSVAQAFDDAVAAKDAKLVTAAFVRAASDEIARRVDGGRANLTDYQSAKVLVIRAQRFYTAIAGDLPPDQSKIVGGGLQKALDAIGNPGVFGVGARPADPAAYAAARAEIFKALGKTP